MGMIIKNGVPYGQGSEIPRGGTKGQVLAKASNLDGDTEWKDEEGGGGGGDAYTKAETDALLNAKQNVLTTGKGAKIDNNVISFDYVTAGKKAVAYSGPYTKTVSVNLQYKDADYTFTEYIDFGDMGFTSPSDYSLEIIGSIVHNSSSSIIATCLTEAETSRAVWSGTRSSFTVAKENNRVRLYGWFTGPSSGYQQHNFTCNILCKVYYTGQDASGLTVDTAMSDSSENPVQNKIIKAELDKKAEGYIVPEILTPVDLETAGQPSFMRAGQIFMLSQRGVVGGQRYTFTQADVDNLVNVTDQNGITFTVTSSGGDSTQITMLGTPPSNVIYMPNMALSGTTAAFLIDPEEVHQIDARLIPGGGGTGGGNANFDIGTVPLGGAGVYEVNAFLSNNDSERVRAIYSRGVNGELPDWFSMSVTSGLGTDDFHVATKEYADKEVAKKQDTLVSGTNIKTVNGDSLLGAGNLNVGVNIEVNKEKWYGTYTDENGVTYQVYSKMIYIPALPSTAGITAYDHGISGIKQILQVYGFTSDGFVLNAPRQTTSDNIAIYQMSKSATNKTLSIEVGKDRSNKSAYVVMVYAKNN